MKGNECMFYTDEKKDAIVIFTGKTARYLLKLGYTIIDVKPDKKNKIKSVFVFKKESGIDKAISDYLYDKDILEE